MINDVSFKGDGCCVLIVLSNRFWFVLGIISNAYKKHSTQQQNGTKHLIIEMNKVNEKLTKARELLLQGDIDPVDYRTIKAECEEKINRLEAKLAETTTNTSTPISIDKLIDKAVWYALPFR